MIQSGYSTAQIVAQSRISDSTLRTHLRNIYSKAEVSGRLGLLRRLLAEESASQARRERIST